LIHKPPSAPRPPSYFYYDYRDIFESNFIASIKVVIDAIFMFFLSLRTSASSAVNNSGWNALEKTGGIYLRKEHEAGR